MRIAPIILGNVISSRFLKRPPRSTNIAWFTDQCFLTEEILPTLDIEKALFSSSPMTQKSHLHVLHVLKQLIHTGIPPQELLLSYIMVLSLSLANSSDISITNELKEYCWNPTLFPFHLYKNWSCSILEIPPPHYKIYSFVLLLHYWKVIIMEMP